MIVDVHAHYIPKNFSDLMGDRVLPRVGACVKTGSRVIRSPTQDYEAYKETFGYIERLGLPNADTDTILRHNAQALFGVRH
jgi:hypothetical protein